MSGFHLLIEESHLDKALQNKEKLGNKFVSSCHCVMAEAYEASGYGGFKAAYRRALLTSDGYFVSVGSLMERITLDWDSENYAGIREKLPSIIEFRLKEKR